MSIRLIPWLFRGVTVRSRRKRIRARQQNSKYFNFIFMLRLISVGCKIKRYHAKTGREREKFYGAPGPLKRIRPTMKTIRHILMQIIANFMNTKISYNANSINFFFLDVNLKTEC